MAKQTFIVHIDLSQNELQNAVIQNLAAAPSSPIAGQIYFDTVKQQLGVYDGTAWSYGGDITNVLGDATSGIQVSVDGNGVATVSQLASSASQNGYMSSSDKTKLDAATNLNTPSTIVMRDASGDFVANDISANKVTGLAAPTANSDAANKEYVDSVASGLDVKASCVALSDSNITISGTTTIDGVPVVANDRVLLTGQTNAIENGIWLVQTGSWTRPSDFAAGSNAAGAFTFVEQGTNYSDSGWVCTSNTGSAIVGTDPLSWSQFSGAGQITAGTGLSKTGNTINANAADASIQMNTDDFAVARDIAGAVGLSVSGIKVNVDSDTNPTIQIASNEVKTTNYIAKTVYKTVTVGTVAGAQVITHNLGTRNLNVQAFQSGSPYNQVQLQVAYTSTSTITVSANGANQSVDVVITGNVGVAGS